jgi:chemotaxis protein MotB
MMTMFVLFLCMYAYQSANQEFLLKKSPEIIGGDTTEALRTLDSSGASFPFAPIHPGLPLMTGGSVKKVEQIKIESMAPEAVYPSALAPPPMVEEGETPRDHPSSVGGPAEADRPAPGGTTEENVPSLGVTTSPKPAPADMVEPPIPPEAAEPQATVADRFQEIYTLSKDALENNNLDKFVAIDIIPDKTMRIILTGDLLFALGESELSEDAQASLQKIVEVMRHTPYMVNIVGHTDNLPMRSNRFQSNWELSVARASTVARFLIEEMAMNPNQFVVSGYSSNRPIAPNTTAENRAKNRRVEIIISKRLPNPLPPTAENLE